MQTVKRIGGGILFGSMVFLLFLVVFESFLQIPSWLAVAGRLHPMFLHFPIVLLLISFFTMWIPVGKGADNEWLALLRLVAALSAVITAILGMLLSLEDAGEGNVLLLHKWGGVSIAILGFLFYSYHNFLVKHVVFTKLFTIVATFTIIITGHWGANLTHGENYVLAPIQKQQRDLTPPDKAVVFADVIQPILESKCTSCHSTSKLKGELLLENMEGLLAGGKSGPLFIPGQPDTSLLIRRLHLPMDDKKHMPPASKPQLTETESALLYAWIKAGAATEDKLFSLPEQDTFRILATAYLQPAVPTQPVYDFKAADEKKILALNNNYRIIVPLGKNSPALSVNLYGRNIFTSKALEELLPLKQQIVELNLSRLPVKDEDIKLIRQLTNIEKLNLNYTDVTAKGVEQLGTLTKLRELTLSGTAVTAPALEKILPLPELKSVFVWDTKIDSVQLQPLKAKFSNVYIETGFIDNGDVMVALSPPVIKTPQGIFNKTTTIEIRHPFKGVDIRYTLDGTPPDSVSGLLYTEPVAINESVTLIANAYKKGWYGSTPVQAAFIKQGFAPDSISFITKPDPKYSAETPGLLTDGALGDYANFSNGEWLGYQKNEAAYYFFFNNKVTPKNILLQMLQNTGGHIFPPAKVEVWGGMDEGHMQLLGKLAPRVPEKNEPARSLQENIQLTTAELHCLKIILHPVASLPPWHNSKGSPGWIFLSEIVVN
ncbi:c-type cytochrome domain-containing protein [Agriterribacter sp.]|uniref:c-type cytochrome domain-containing protein n=1 Tax=Agriterribacter sp. TaxID=2821509 RepID=UPI002D07312A|nr:c-type cytochrome domain-containing protein [Agriterribacter sp.]HRO46936.1 chitobiase/beta-hexosaminidase C-terminal domain-containing protein [Agriterribacter sp.]HRQ17430.1 chitobiase/beta-hexosaminidase C-terminal domain-containing protein [Agriterribacter sp.]